MSIHCLCQAVDVGLVLGLGLAMIDVQPVEGRVMPLGGQNKRVQLEV